AEISRCFKILCTSPVFGGAQSNNPFHEFSGLVMEVYTSLCFESNFGCFRTCAYPIVRAACRHHGKNECGDDPCFAVALEGNRSRDRPSLRCITVYAQNCTILLDDSTLSHIGFTPE